MFEGKTEKQARKEILEIVSEYCDKYNVPKQYIPGSRIPYASRVYDHEEVVNLVDSALEFWLTSGHWTDKFEQSICDFLGVNYCTFVNSGSSANLLAFMTLTSPFLGDRQIKPGDEIITVACCFPTTVAPCIQYGAVPVFVDISIPQYNIDINLLSKALSPKTRAVVVAHTLGNPFDIEKVKEFCDKHNLWLIEDNCDALGSKYFYNGQLRYTGTVGDIATSSFYPPHHMTTGEGGAVYTNNPLLHKIIRSLRDWGRDCTCPSGKDNSCGHRFTMQYGTLPLGYDHKYVYSHFGFNLKATDLQAAVGCAQIEKLSLFIERRRRNHSLLMQKLGHISDKILLPEPLYKSEPSWFGFLITCKDNIDKNRVVSYLENHGIQTRMLFAGNITRHPCFDAIRNDSNKYRVIDELINTDIVVNKSFWIGVYPGLSDEMIDYIAKTIIDAVQ